MNEGTRFKIILTIIELVIVIGGSYLVLNGLTNGFILRNLSIIGGFITAILIIPNILSAIIKEENYIINIIRTISHELYILIFLCFWFSFLFGITSSVIEENVDIAVIIFLIPFYLVGIGILAGKFFAK